MNIINLNGEIYVQISFLLKYGLNASTIHNGLSRNRKKNNRSYIHFKDSQDKRIVWIKYSSLPKQLFNKFNLPSLLKLTEIVSKKKKSDIEELIHRCLHFAYDIEFKSFRKFYHGVYHDMDSIDNYAQTHAVFSAVLSLKNNNVQIKEIYKVYVTFNNLIFNPKSLKSFYHKLKNFENDGHAAFIHKSFKTERTNKIVSEEHIKKITQLYRHSSIIPGRVIHEKLNRWAIQNGFQLLSLSTIKKILANKEFQNRNKGFRFGKEWVYNNFEPFKLRLDPENNGTQWQLDGTRLQVPYVGENQLKYLMIFVVMDVCSRKIVGFSIGKTENHKVMISAIAMAINNTGYVPRELLADNASCFKHKKFKYLIQYMGFLGSYFRQHAIGRARDKSHVERWISTFQTTILKNVKGYIGEGVKSRREEGRPSERKINNETKKFNLRNRDELESMIPKWINKYNNQKIYEHEHSPNIKYEIGNTDPHAFLVSENDRVLMFWNQLIMRVKQSMILLSEGLNRKKRFQYIIENQDMKYRLNHTEVKVCYNTTDRSIVKIFDLNDNWITDLKLYQQVQSVKSRQLKNRKTKPEYFTETQVLKDRYKNLKPNKENQLFKRPGTLEELTIKTKNND